jgi:hypothetical protein
VVSHLKLMSLSIRIWPSDRDRGSALVFHLAVGSRGRAQHQHDRHVVAETRDHNKRAPEFVIPEDVRLEVWSPPKEDHGPCRVKEPSRDDEEERQRLDLRQELGRATIAVQPSTM